MVGKEATAVLKRGLLKSFRMWYIGLKCFKFQLNINFSVVFLCHIANFCVISAILLFCGMIFSKLFMGTKVTVSLEKEHSFSCM